MDTLFNVEDEVQAALNELGILSKIDEMDDFMNQNELNVTITNENAVVTGLVTYTCTVKDKNNNNLPGRVVEWYKGTTLLGIDATDSNGVSTFSHRVTEADIYDVHAVVRGTHAGDDIRMFVKDKDNLLTHNQWSCTDYLKNTTGFTHSPYCTIESSTEYSVNGERSLKVNKTEDGNAYARIELNDSFLEKIINITGNVKTISGQVYFQLLEINGGIINTSQISIPGGSDDEFSLTLQTGTENTQIILQIIYFDYNGIFLDNLKLTVQ